MQDHCRGTDVLHLPNHSLARLLSLGLRSASAAPSRWRSRMRVSTSPSIATPVLPPPRGPARRSAGSAAVPCCCAPTSPTRRQTTTLLPRVTASFGPVGVLVNNACPFERDEWHDATRASWDAHIEPGLRAPFVLMQQFARVLPEAAEGVVINMLDQRVWSITPHFVSYTVAKAGLWALTQSMALALAPRIRVNGIGPGPALPNTRQTPEQFERQAASTPLHRGTSPDEIARAVLAILALPSMTGPDAGARRRPAPAVAVRAATGRRPQE